MREIILDTETTGLDPFDGHKIIEIGCIEMVNKVKTGKFFHTYINPSRDVPKTAYEIHGISTEFLQDKKSFKEIADEFISFIRDSTLVIHNARFDLKFLNKELDYIDYTDLSGYKIVDTLMLARKMFPGSPASLDALCKRYNVDLSKREKHGALLDAELLADVYIQLTGGHQTKMNFTEQDQNNSLTQNKIAKKFKEPRKFEISEEEVKEHLKLMTKINNPIWQE